jgi:hypothetical protein
LPSPRRGRSLELLVKRIKEHQSPGSIVRSPDFVKDVDTQELREIDIGVHVPIQGGELFIAIECRDRKAKQSVEWVEQLIAKKESVRADVLIAITASDFFRPARIKALKKGVLLARLSQKLPAEIAAISESWFITIRYLAPKILQVQLEFDLLVPYNDDSLFKHISFDQPLTLQQLAEVWVSPNLIRSLPRYISDYSTAKFAKVGISEIEAVLVYESVEYPIKRAQVILQLNYGEDELTLRAVQELSALDLQPINGAIAYDFGTTENQLIEVIADAKSGNLRLDILGRPLLEEGKVVIGGGLRSSKPVSITTIRLDL